MIFLNQSVLIKSITIRRDIFISTGQFRNLYLSKEYTRASYWLAFTQCLNAIQTWYWPHKADGYASERVEVRLMPPR